MPSKKMVRVDGEKIDALKAKFPWMKDLANVTIVNMAIDILLERPLELKE